MKVICVSLLIPNSYGKVLYGFIVICANIARPCTYNVPRNKYLDVRRAYLAYSKLRKRRKSQTRMITRRLLQLLEKLLDQLELLHSSYRNRLTLSSDYQRRFSVIQTVLEQGKNLFAGKKSVQPYREYRPALPSPHYQRQGNQIR